MVRQSTRRKHRPSPLSETEERVWSGHIPGSREEDRTPSLERSSTMVSSGGGSGSLPRSEYRPRAKSMAPSATFQMSEPEATRLLQEFQQLAGAESHLHAGVLLHQMCSDDEPATLDELTRLQSPDITQEPPEILCTPFEFDELLALTDLSNPESPLCQAIVEHFGCPLSDVPKYEFDRIYPYCFNMLSTVNFNAKASHHAAKTFLTSCLQTEGYKPEVCIRLPLSSAYRPGAEKTVNAAQLLKYMGLPDTPQTEALADAVEQAVTLLNSPLYDGIIKHSYEAMLAEIQMVSVQLDAAYKLLPDSVRPRYLALAEDIGELAQDLEMLSGQVKLLKKNDFRSKENNQNSINALFLAALDILKSPANGAHARVKRTLEELYMKAMAKSDFWPDAIARLLGCEQVILEELSKVELDSEFHGALVAKLQDTQAQTVVKDILLKMGEQEHSGQITFQPAACIRVEPPPTPEEEFDVLHEEVASTTRTFTPFEEDYGDQFCPSIHRAEKDHCIALTLVSMKIGDETVYEEVRAGVPYAYPIKDELERASATEKRWHEVFTATLVQQHSAPLRDAMANHDHAPIELPLFYNCLLSPDQLRSFIQDKVLDSGAFQAVAGKITKLGKLQAKAREVNDDEQRWCQKMREDMQSMDGQVITLTVRDRSGLIYPVRIRPKLFMAITPCNELVYGGGLLSNTKAWKYADHVTGDTIKALFGSLDPESPIGGHALQVMKTLDTQSAKYREIIELAFMIRRIFKDKLHHTLTNDPMFFSNLLTETGRMLGTTNLIGCKSAKDRTGNKSQSDMRFALQCKLARDQFDQGIPIRILPGQGRRITWQDIFNSCQLTLNSCQTEWQAKSTAIPGYKMKGFMLGFADIVFAAVNRKVEPNTDWLLKD